MISKLYFKCLELIEEKRGFQNFDPLRNLGACGIHVVNGSLKCGKNESEWKMGETLKAMSKLLKDSPARRDTYVKVAETNVFSLPYCRHGCLFFTIL